VLAGLLSPVLRRWSGTGLQTRVTLLAGAAVAVALTAGAVLLVTVLRAGLTDAGDERVRSRVEEVVRLVEEGRLPSLLPSADPTILVQVLEPGGAVLAASTGASRAVPLLGADEVERAVSGDEAVLVEGDRVGYGDRLRVLVRATDRGPVVLAATPVSSVDDPLRVVRGALLVGLPLLLLASAGGVWLTVGRTLRPVEQLRAGAEAVTAADPARRLPVPAAEDEVRRLAETLNGMLDRLEAGSARQRAFVADAAHELRSPLAALRTVLEVALVHPDPDGPEPTLRTALEEVLRMARLVDDLLLLARLDAGAPRRVQEVDLADVVRELVPDGRRPRPVAGRVVADPDALVRVVRNLVDNARRHATRTVAVTLRQPRRAGRAAGRRRRSRHPAAGPRAGLRPLPPPRQPAHARRRRHRARAGDRPRAGGDRRAARSPPRRPRPAGPGCACACRRGARWPTGRRACAAAPGADPGRPARRWRRRPRCSASRCTARRR
jgi:signal transduction histidine kinase